MKRLLQVADNVLRAGFGGGDGLRNRAAVSRNAGLFSACLFLGAVYGLFMGLHAVFRSGGTLDGFLQLAATLVKVPLLFLLTLAVTYPSLYVFSVIAGSPLRFVETARLLLMGVLVNLTLLASFGPVTGFFTLSTESYRFMLILNVVLFALGGAAGITFVGRALNAAQAPDSNTGMGPRVVLRIWILIYAVVGAQMGWILRPFVGSPDLAFSFFRRRESNFFQAVFHAIKDLAGSN